jgi:hypothetical protein
MRPGIPLTDGTTTIVVPAMNLRISTDPEYVPLLDRITSANVSTDADRDAYAEACIVILLACARLNHPDLKRETLLDLVDSADLAKLIASVLFKSGFKPRPLGEAAPEQEAPANPSAAPASSDSSSMPPDGSPTTSSTG